MTTDPQPIRKSDLPTTPPPEFEFFTWFPWPDGDGGDMVRGQRQRGVQVRRLVSYGDWEPVRPDRWADEPAFAGLGVSATPSHTDLRQRIAEALLDHLSRTADIRPTASGELAFMPEVTDTERLRLADVLAAVLPPPADRAAVLREADWIEEHCPDHGCVEPETDGCHCEIAKRLSRLADEAQQQPTDRDVVEAHDVALSFTLKADEALQQEPPVHGESVAHLAGDHDNEPAVDARQDGAQS